MRERQRHCRGGTALGWETLQYSLQFLMTRFAHSRDPQVARIVVEHLEMLLGHPRIQDEEMEFRELYIRLLAHWRNLADPRASPSSSHPSSRKPLNPQLTRDSG